jgi:hypothetical protein
MMTGRPRRVRPSARIEQPDCLRPVEGRVLPINDHVELAVSRFHERHHAGEPGRVAVAGHESGEGLLVGGERHEELTMVRRTVRPGILERRQQPRETAVLQVPAMEIVNIPRP